MDKTVIQTHIKNILSASEQERLVLFVGAGVSANSGVPVWNTLISGLEAELPPFARGLNDSLKLAQIYKTTYPAKFVTKVKEILKDGKIAPNPIHDVLLDLHPVHIITTNYDNLIEQACANRFEQFSVISEDADLPIANSNKLLIKMHGDFTKGNIVLAEKDYYDYSRKFPLIRSFVMSLFASKVVLFVGFSFDDINLKYILRELQSILEKNMQPVYLLTDTDMEHEQLKYLEDKGICPICLSRGMLDDLEKLQPHVPVNPPTSLDNLHGQNLYRQLTLISNFSEIQAPLESLVKSLTRYEEQISVFGEYLKYIAPDYLQQYWHQTFQNLTIDEKWFREQFDSTRTLAGLLAFFRKHKTAMSILMAIAYKNQIYYLYQECPLFNARRYHRIMISRDGVTEFYIMNIEKVHERMAELSSARPTMTRKDLEYPYLLYKVGSYRSAFQCYLDLASEFWKNKNYILYMICRVNLHNLASTLLAIDSSALSDKEKQISKEDLAEILKSLPFDKGIRRMFSDLISYKILLSKVETTEKLSERIEKQREKSNNGGFDWNNYAIELLHIFSFLVDFGNDNYIICENLKSTKNAFYNIAKGLIDSHMVKGELFQNSRLEKVPPHLFILLLFHLGRKELRSILSRCDNRDFDVDDDSKRYIQQVVTNLIYFSKNQSANKNTRFANVSISNVVFNLCAILCHLPKELMPETGLYHLIAKYMRVNEIWDYSSILGRLFDKKEPTTEESEQIIKIYLDPIAQSQNNPWLISRLVAIMANAGKEIRIERDFSKYEKLSLLSLAALRPIMSEERKVVLDYYIKSHLNDLIDGIIIEMETECRILDKELFERLKDDFLGKILKEDVLYASAHIKRMYIDDRFAEYRPMIEEIKTHVSCLAFLLEPTANIDKMEVEWLLALEKEQLQSLLRNHEAMQKIDILCQNSYDYISKAVKDTLWNVIVTHP